MPQSIPAGITSEHILAALAELDRGVEHGFGRATKFQLVDSGRSYDPKAVIGLAVRHLRGVALGPKDFSGGEAPGQANYVLRRLGFRVIRKPEVISELKEAPWDADELQRLLGAYVSDLQSILNGDTRSVAEATAASPSQRIAERTPASIDRQRRRLSALLLQRGLPYLDAYEPLAGLPAELSSAANAWLRQESARLDALSGASVEDSEIGSISVSQLLRRIVAPPDEIVLPVRESRPWVERRGRRVDYAERDAGNRRLGERAEQLVLGLERTRLQAAGRDDLAARVEWTSRERGDGVGFDILSFDEVDDTERMIEVKGTRSGRHTPFYVSQNEVRCSDDMSEQYQLYRVFNMSTQPHLYILHGSLSSTCQLEAVTYRAGLRPRTNDP